VPRSDHAPPSRAALVVLRPKVAWRLLLPPLFVAAVVVLAGGRDGDAVTWWKGWASLVFLGLGALASWRSRIELHPGTIYRRSLIGWTRPISAPDIEEVTLEYEILGIPHRELTLNLYDKRGSTISLRWWSGWWQLIRWLTTYCTRLEDGQQVWAVRTDAKTRDRLEPYARPLVPEEQPA
jgi:hypothetical protein